MVWLMKQRRHWQWLGSPIFRNSKCCNRHGATHAEVYRREARFSQHLSASPRFCLTRLSGSNNPWNTWHTRDLKGWFSTHSSTHQGNLLRIFSPNGQSRKKDLTSQNRRCITDTIEWLFQRFCPFWMIIPKTTFGHRCFCLALTRPSYGWRLHPVDSRAEVFEWSQSRWQW